VEKNFKLHNQLKPKEHRKGKSDHKREERGENSGFKPKGKDGGSERSESFDKPKYKRDERGGEYKKREGGGERKEGGYKKEYKSNNDRGGYKGNNDRGGYKGERSGGSGGGEYKRREGGSSYQGGYKGSNHDGRSENRNSTPAASSENGERPRYQRERNDRDYKKREGGGGSYRGERWDNRGGGRKFNRDDRRGSGRDRGRDNRREKNEDGFYERKSPKESYVVYGKHPVLAALKNENRVKTKLFVTQNGQEFLRERLGNEIFQTIEVQNVMPDLLDRIIGEQDRVTHQGVGLEVKPLYVNFNLNTESLNKLCILDDITDPHNVGAIIRTAKAFGFDAVITEEKNSPNENATICKTSAGVLEIMPYVRIPSLHNLIEDLKAKNYEIIGLDGKAEETIENYKTDKKVALIIGAEGKGLSPHLKRLCDKVLCITINNSVESLNASVAAALALNKFRG